MDLYLIWVAFILGIVEGATEFLPVSSTGHLIIAADLLNFSGDSSQVFEIFIQLGAILAVMIEYRKKIAHTFSGLHHSTIAQNFTLLLIIAFIPAALLGFFFHEAIKFYLFNPIAVAIALIIGGIIIILIEKFIPARQSITVDEINKKQALYIGLAQCLSLIPGVSRAGATIMGGLVAGLDRKTATEFSFFLAIPIIVAASLFDLSQNYHLLSRADLIIFFTGFVTAFVSALLVIKLFIHFVAHHDFVIFGWYRILIGFLTLWYFY